MRRYTAVKYSILICLALFIHSRSLPASEQDEYSKVLSLMESGNYSGAGYVARTFIKKHPSSTLIPPVRVVLAELEHDPNNAISAFKSIQSKFKSFQKRDYCQFKICEILYFSARWQDLEREALTGIKEYKQSSHYYPDFLYFVSKAAFYQHDYTKAQDYSAQLIRNYKTSPHYADQRIQFTYTSQKVAYDSDSYKTDLKNSYYELPGTGAEVSSLYLLARHLEYNHQYDYSYSLYTDLVKKYPRSPEALLAAKRMEIIKKENPKYVADTLAKLKDEENSIVDSLSPTRDVEEVKSENYYALSIGPFYNLKEAQEIKSQLGQSFTDIYVVRVYKKFVIYVSKSASQDEIMHEKIRLAEEFAINADIIYITESDGVKSVHGE